MHSWIKAVFFKQALQIVAICWKRSQLIELYLQCRHFLTCHFLNNLSSPVRCYLKPTALYEITHKVYAELHQRMHLRCWYAQLPGLRYRYQKKHFLLLSSFRIPQPTGEQPVAALLVSHKERTVVVLPRQGEEQTEPASCDARGLQHFARPQPRAPLLLQDWHGRHTAGHSRGR